MVRLPLPPQIIVDTPVKLQEIEFLDFVLHISKFLENHIAAFSTLHPMGTTIVVVNHRLLLVNRDFGVREYLVWRLSQKMLNIKFQVVVSEISQMLEEFPQ